VVLSDARIASYLGACSISKLAVLIGWVDMRCGLGVLGPEVAPEVSSATPWWWARRLVKTKAHQRRTRPSRLELQSAVVECIEAFYNRHRRIPGHGLPGR
jgi:hypothetical protein